MGLFSKKPSITEQSKISELIFHVQSDYKTMYDGCGVEIYVNCKKRTKSNLNELVSYEKKYPSFFKNPTPTENLRKVISEMPEVERHYVDYLIVYIEKKLLNYSTDRGKRNNFNKESDKFKYYADEFLPETVDYFNQLINERFSEYV